MDNADLLLTNMRELVYADVQAVEDLAAMVAEMQLRFQELDNHLMDGGRVPRDWNYLRVGCFVIEREDDSFV